MAQEAGGESIPDTPAATEASAPPPTASPPVATVPPPVAETAAPVVAPGPLVSPRVTAPATGEFEELNLESLLRLNVVTASGGVAESADLAPANVFTVLRSEIISHGWRSVAEVLAHVPGMYVVDDYVTSHVGVRGASGGLRAGTRIVKVMINGTDVNFRPDLNAFIGPEFIPIEAVERIEIARGPLSALYGANAFLATVNVITVEPGRNGGAIGVSGGLRGSRVSVGDSAVAMASLGKRAKALLAASYERINRGGLTIQQTFDAQDGLPNNNLGRESGDDLARPLSVFGRVLGDLGAFGELALQGGMQQSDSQAEFQLGSVLTGQSRSAIRNLWTEAQHRADWTGWLSSSVAAGYSHGGPIGNDRWYVTGNVVPNTNNYYMFYTRNFNYDAVDGKASLTAKPTHSLRVTGGVDASYENHGTLYYTQHYLQPYGVFNPGDVNNVNPARDHTLTKVAPNLHFSWDPIAAVRLSADGRLDILSQFPNQLSGRAAAGWRILPNLVAKAIAGQAFQTPSMVFLYAQPGFGNTDIVGARNLSTASPLVPQTVRSIEAVLSYVQGDRLSANVAGYYQSIKNQISFLSNLTNYYARNQGVADSVGVEANLTVRVWRFEPYGRLNLQWFGTDPSRRPIDRGPTIPPPLIPARWGLLGLRASLPSPKITLDATWRFVGERGASQSNIFLNSDQSYALKGYNQLDLAASTTVNLLGPKRDSQILLGVRNLSGSRHFEPGFGGIDIPSLGRSFFLSLRQEL